MWSGVVGDEEPGPTAPVIPAKLRPPRARPGELGRERLVRTLLASDAAVVVLRAGAGYGKTTTVRQWADVDDRPAAWVSVDEHDNDPVRLLRHVVRALGGAAPLPEVEALLAAGPPAVHQQVLPALATALARRPPSLLVLDDADLIVDPPSVAVLEGIAAALRPGSALALLGQGSLSVRVGRRVAGGGALVLRHRDLAFDADECARLIARRLPEVAPAQVDLLAQRTEGWPAALQLVLLAAGPAGSLDSVLRDLPNQADDLTDYVHEELLRRLDPDTRDFLLRTAPLERLTAPLCDEVLGRSDSARLLRRLAESDNLFVVAHDDDHQWYRYHGLFAQLLLADLRAAAPDDEAGLRRRAARWMAAHDDPDGAIAQAVAAGDLGLAAEIAYASIAGLVQRGLVVTLDRWCAWFPETAARRDPLLALLHGWADFVNGRPGVHGWLELIEGLDRPGPLPDGTRSLEVARSGLAMLAGAGGVKATAAHAGAVRRAGVDGSPWWGTGCLLETNARLLIDPDLDGVALWERAELSSRGEPATHAVALSHLAWARYDAGDGAGADAAIAAALEGLRVHHLDDFVLAVHVHAVAAFAAARRGERERAVAEIATTERLLDEVALLVPRAQCENRLVAVEAALLVGEVERAQRLLGDAERQLAAEPDAVVLWDWVDDARERLADRVLRQRTVDRIGLTAAEERVLRLLPTHRTLQEIGRELYVSRNTVKTHVASICRKLGVSGRSAAVERATELGLVATPER
ncbi:MAG: hypothetical protein KDB35_08325 [Acidimicrobiales bacterium]|nr:hypothetical protein [Acidimicrobiales bacterium]MCB1016588.1 hypothetical protein [Acidimicrobiales bacterium]